MIRKLMILAGVFILFQFGFSKIDMKEWQKHKEDLLNSEITAEEAYQELVEADSLGYDFYNIYLNVLLKQTNSEQLLEKVFENSKTNAGRIVVLQGIYEKNSKKYKELKNKLNGVVTIFYGCYSVPENAKEYIEKVEKLHINKGGNK